MGAKDKFLHYLSWALLFASNSALRALSSLYGFSETISLVSNSHRLVFRDRYQELGNVLKSLNVMLGLPKFDSFHTLCSSGAILVFNACIPIQDIMRHRTWSSDCVW